MSSLTDRLRERLKSKAVARAQKGAAFLDRVLPDWASRVNPAAIRIESTTECVLGQIYGRFSEGVNALGISFGQSARYGFNRPRFLFQRLNRAWAAEVRRRS